MQKKCRKGKPEAKESGYVQRGNGREREKEGEIETGS